MYTWKLEIILNSGKEITVYYKGDENTSDNVARKVLVDGYGGFGNVDGTANVLINIKDISAMTISAA